MAAQPPAPVPGPAPAAPPGDEALQKLLAEHYPPVCRLACALLHDQAAAQRAAARALALARNEQQRRKRPIPRKQVYTLALKAIQEEEHAHHPPGATPPASQASATTESGPSLPPSPGLPERPAGEAHPSSPDILQDAGSKALLPSPQVWRGAGGEEPALAPFWQAVDALGGRERRLFLLRYLLGWEPGEAAALLGVAKGAVKAQLELFRKQFRPLLQAALRHDPPAAHALARDEALEGYLAQLVQGRWPEIVLSAGELGALAQQVEALAAAELARPAPVAPWLAAGISLALVLCVAGSLAGWAAGSRLMDRAYRSTATATPPGMPTPVTPAAQAAPLARRSSSNQVRVRWIDSSKLWNTLWVDMQTVDYGPASYRGAPRTYRSRAWLSQPSESVELFGLLGDEPASFYQVSYDTYVYNNAAIPFSDSGYWYGGTEQLLHDEYLRAMVFPAFSPWTALEGQFNAVQTVEFAGRPAVVFDWLDPQGRRAARLWLDTQTGIILQAEEYGGEAGDILLRQRSVTAIGFDQAGPPPGLVDEALQGANPEGIDRDVLGRLPTPTLAASPGQRPGLALDPPPSFFDSAGSQLIFQFANNSLTANATARTAQSPADLFADGYWLGSLRFGLPWMLRCTRSPDGQRLAFNTTSDGTAPPDEVLRWFNLSEPQPQYQPLPLLRAASFAFSPDSRHLAVAGEGGLPGGVYLVNVGTGEASLLLEAAGARSLAWSPDGEYLALIGTLPGEEQPAAIVIYLRSGQIVHQGPLEQPGDLAPLDSPILLWGVPFPTEMGGMEDCARR